MEKGKIISHSRPCISDEDISKVAEVVASGRLADSSQVGLFEKELSAYIGQKGGIATNSGTNALHLALSSIPFNHGSEAIIPSYVCIAVLNAVICAGLHPVMVDIAERGFNISLEDIEKKLNRRTRAIIVPHMLGDPVETIDEIVALGVPVIEDCALSVGATRFGKKLGSYSDTSIFSFYATKMLATGQGGMVLSRSARTLEDIRDMMVYDNRKSYRKSYNFRMTDMQAALGRSQLARLDDFIGRRRKIASQYHYAAKGRVELPYRPSESVFFRYVMLVDDPDSFIKEMLSQGIDCRRPVFKPLHQYFHLPADEFPNTERMYSRSVSIPLYPALKDEEVEHIVRVLQEL
ncbi:MAG: DegT/DnrJ/EryC1/StrS family aminotransferase [Nanoarchaeota archaeon]